MLAYKKFSSHPDVRDPMRFFSSSSYALQGEEEVVAKSSANAEEEKRVGNMFYNNSQVHRIIARVLRF